MPRPWLARPGLVAPLGIREAVARTILTLAVAALALLATWTLCGSLIARAGLGPLCTALVALVRPLLPPFALTRRLRLSLVGSLALPLTLPLLALALAVQAGLRGRVAALLRAAPFTFATRRSRALLPLALAALLGFGLGQTVD